MNNLRFKELDIALSILIVFIGCVFAFVPYESLKTFLCIVLGIYIIFSNIPSCIYYFSLSTNNKKYLPYASFSLIAILVGFLFLFWPNVVLTYILAIILIALPIARICISNNKKEQIKKELPLIITGILLCFTPFAVLIEIVLKIFGGILILYGIIYFIITIKSIKNDNNDNFPNNSTKNKDYIDVDVKEV